VTLQNPECDARETNTHLLIADPERGFRLLYADPSSGDEMQNQKNEADDQQNVE
jgi:hypothetical protein